MNEIEQLIDLVFDPTEYNPGNMSKLLYQSILNEFSIKLTIDERKIYSKYVSYVFDLIELLRETKIPDCKKYFEQIYKKDPYVIDNIIMMWCLPRSEQYMSKIMYYKAYKNNIANFNGILYEMRNENYIMYFCIDILSKPCKCPIHCIDIIWNSLIVNKLNIDSIILTRKKFDYIEFNLDEEQKDNNISICLNIQEINEFGLGYAPNEFGKTFNQMIDHICSD